MSILRISTAKFKDNMRPFVQRAKTGEVVIVTSHGEDDFQVVPCVRDGPPPVLSGLVKIEAYNGIDLDEPAFESLR
jgi:prevent-host-death family protein